MSKKYWKGKKDKLHYGEQERVTAKIRGWLPKVQ